MFNANDVTDHDILKSSRPLKADDVKEPESTINKSQQPEKTQGMHSKDEEPKTHKKKTFIAKLFMKKSSHARPIHKEGAGADGKKGWRILREKILDMKFKSNFLVE